jgi:acetoin:2,6-dichlorophenolindophenol oxidoreductase subunit alpha
MAGSSTGGSLIDDAKLKQLYAAMLRCRLLTEHGRRVRRSKLLFDASQGQEAIVVGCAVDLRPQDTVAVASHDSIVSLVKGVALSDVVAQMYGRHSTAGWPAQNIIAPSSRTVSGQGAVYTAAGNVALASKREDNGNVVVVFSGAVATASESWRQALKIAAKRGLPIIFVVENNPWTGTQVKNGMGKLTLKAQTDGLTSITVDGNDVVAVYRVAYESLERVRKGGGAVMIEAKPYRQHGQVLLNGERDPLTHMEQYLTAKKLFTTRWKNGLVQQFSRELDAVVRKVEG